MVKSDKSIRSSAIKLVGIGATVGCLVGAVVAGAGTYAVKENQLNLEKATSAKLAKSVESGKLALEAAQMSIADLKSEKMALEVDKESLKTELDLSANEVSKLKAEVEADDLMMLDLNEKLAECSAEVAVKTVNGKVIEVDLGESVGAETLDDRDIAQLQDKKIKFDGDKYDVHEVIKLSEDVKIGISGYSYDEEFGALPYLVTEAKEALTYEYVFDDEVEADDVDTDEVLSINFLGENMDIVEVGDDYVTVRQGTEEVMSEGEERLLTINGKEVTVKVSVISDSLGEVKFIVNGESSKKLGEGDTDKVGDYEILVDEILPDEAGDMPEDLVTFWIAEDEVLKDIEDGDYVDEDTKEWKYFVNVDEGKLKSIGVKYNVISDELDDDVPALAVGESISFPNDFATVTLKSVTDQEYMPLKLSFDEYGDENVPVLVFEAEGLLVGDEEVSEVYFDGETLYYEDEEGDEQTAELSDLVLENGDTELGFEFEDGVLSFSGISVEIDDSFEHFGELEEDAESDELVYNETGFGTSDKDVLTADGFVIKDPEGSLEDDELEVLVPSEEPVVEVLVE